MSINDLELILKKDPIISTWPARSLYDTPQDVEKDYHVHAKTHLSLGDTAKYVDIAFRWVSGANKGTFIGAVLGEYGEGKTSFLVHVWAQSHGRNVCTVPPFEWSAFEEIVDAIAGWIQYILQGTYPALARRMQRVHESFRQQTIEEIARDMAQTTKQDYDSTLEMVRSLIGGGKVRLTEMSAARLLDFVEEASRIVTEAGYQGLLVLLDEPEVAAKKLGNETVQHFVFDLANELHRRQGDYGVFLSMPANFFASAQSRFSALPARLEVRQCFPRLSDIYGPTFAQDLWHRYVKEFELGEEGHNLVSPLALQAIGQIGASESRHLSYGPRSVVSAFRRMVDHYHETGQPYEPHHLVQDLLDQEITVNPDYRSRILSVQRSPDVNDNNRDALMMLEAFPSGLQNKTLRELGIEDVLRPLSRADGLVYRTAFAMGLRALRQAGERGDDASPLRNMIEEIDGEYAPDRRAFQNALKAFVRDVIPLILNPKKGQQLVGWQDLHQIQKAANGVYLGTMGGAFQQSVHRFPSRAMLLLVNGMGMPLDRIQVPSLDDGSGRQEYDLTFHIELRWSTEQALPAPLVQLREDPASIRPAKVYVCFDLAQSVIKQDHLAEMVGADRLTLLWVLNLFERMQDVKHLPREAEAEWKALREIIFRQVPGLLFGETFNAAMAHAAEEKLEERVSGSGLVMLGNVVDVLLSRRYPDYRTLIRQPRWQAKVDDYINALNSNEIPLACKRGREPWKADADLASRVLNTSRMNLTGGAFEGFEHLIEIQSKGRQAPLEITFHIHPLEQEIRELITSQPTGADRKLKKDGKECWYIPISSLLPIILQAGYTVEELNKIILIGRARSSFDIAERAGEQVIYSVPLDPEELKAQLRAKLSDLVAEIDEYRRLPDYYTRFDPEEMASDIEKAEDDADHDRLMTRMNKEFEQNHSRLPGYFDRVQEKLQRVRSQVSGIRDQLSGSREIAQLKLPRATSPWGAALGRYIVPNSQQTVDTLKKGAKALFDEVDEDLMRFSYSRQRIAPENLSLLREGWSETNDLESRVNTLCESTRKLMQQLIDFSKWSGLLSQSDQVYERLLELRRESAHQGKAEELIGRFDGISQEIAEHIELRNVEGLPHYRQFEQRFNELDASRQEYLAGLKGSFDQCKDKVNQFLATLNIDGRVKAVFNPQHIAGCYDELYSEGARLVDKFALDTVLSEIAMQERELLYARDILRVIEPDAAAPLLADLEDQHRKIEALKRSANKTWLRNLVEFEGDGQVQDIAKEIAGAFDTVRRSRQKVRESTTPQEPSDGRVQQMYAMLPEQQAIDLKELVLQMMAQIADPSQALDVSLEGLADLFRRNCVQINVGRRRR